jgi:hypothetical protein
MQVVCCSYPVGEPVFSVHRTPAGRWSIAALYFGVLGDEPSPVIAAKRATSTIPIVFASVAADPAGIGLVASLSRPGGNVTGISSWSRPRSAPMDANRSAPSDLSLSLTRCSIQAVFFRRRHHAKSPPLAKRRCNFLSNTLCSLALLKA